MFRSSSAMTGLGLLACLAMVGCGGNNSSVANVQPGSDPVTSAKRAGSIPPVGVVRVKRDAGWMALFQAPGRAVDTSLAVGSYSTTSGAPTAGTVTEEHINAFSASAASSTYPMVWTLTPTLSAGNTADTDLGIYSAAWGAFASSSHVDNWEEWVAFDPTAGRYFGLAWGAPDGVTTHAFNIEADLAVPLTVNGATRTGKENVGGSDWFYFVPLWNPGAGAYDPVTIVLTGVGGDDPDVYVYDTYYGQGSAPVAAGYAVGNDTVPYAAPTGYRIYARVLASSAVAAPCDYTIKVTSP